MCMCVCVFKMEEELFNPDYVEVDRVLEVSYCEDKDSREVAIALWIVCLCVRLALCVVHEGMLSLCLLFCESLKTFFLCACVAGGVLPGEMVLIAVWGQHMGVEGRCRPD